MKPKSLPEIENILASETFSQWFRDMKSLRLERYSLVQKRRELSDRVFHMELGAEREQQAAIELYREATDLEDAVTVLEAESAEIENLALSQIASFEEIRFSASDAWVQLEAAEKNFEDAREKLEAAKLKEGDYSGYESEFNRFEKEYRQARRQYAMESENKESKWLEVESLWDKCLELNLLACERRTAVEKKKTEAEKRFRSVDRMQEEVAELRKENNLLEETVMSVRNSIDAGMESAVEKFSAITGDDFLYWPSSEISKKLWAIPLSVDTETYSIELRPENIYRISPGEGKLLIEPANPDETETHEDDRIDKWFKAASNSDTD